MVDQWLIAVIGGAGFALGGIVAYPRLRNRFALASATLFLGTILGLLVNLLFIAQRIHRDGPVETFGRNFDSTLLLATLIGLVGLCIHLSKALRGLDGFLLVVAAAAQFGSLSQIDRPEMAVIARPWFISHALAFSLSGTLFIAGGLAGVAYLLVHRMLRRHPTSRLLGNVASLESLERFGRWMPLIGFPLFTYGILTGLCGIAHRKDIAGHGWYLDPGFVSALVAWMVYAYLSYCTIYRPAMRGRRAATLSMYALGIIVVVFLVREFLSPMHQTQ